MMVPRLPVIVPCQRVPSKLPATVPEPKPDSVAVPDTALPDCVASIVMLPEPLLLVFW